MNYLKIKLGLFSLLAVLAVSVFLTSCEQETIETTPSDVLLESLEETTNTSNTTGIDEFQDMLFSQTRVPVFADDGSNMFIELNGELLVASDGAITGSVTAVSDDEAVDGTVTFRNEIIIYETENGRVEFNIFSDLENLTVFENDVTKKATLSNSIDKLIEDKDKRLTELSIEVQAVRAYLAIFNSEAFIANARYAQSSDNMNLRHDCSAWQTFIVISLASVVAAPVGFTCLAALPPCIGGSMAFPPAAVPCIVGEVACAAAATAGFAGAREILEAWICSGELPPAPEPCHGPDWIQGNTTGGGTVNLWWDDSADYYWLYHWDIYNGGWIYIGRFYNASATLGATQGNWYFAAEGVCGGSTGQGIRYYTHINVPAYLTSGDTGNEIKIIEKVEVE